MRRRTPAACLAALLALTAAAQDKPTEAPRPGPAEVTVRLDDGTVIRKATLRDGVVVVTRFGKLTVPAAEIRRIEFGFRLPADVAREVESAVRQLGSDEYPQREVAGKRLVALGARAWPALQAAARSSDKEVATRARAALDHIRKEVPSDKLSLPEQDVVYTRDCVLAGRVEGEALKAGSASLGQLSLRLTELRSLQSGAVDRSEVAVDAAQFAGAPERWADSGVTVQAGVGLVVSASGRVDLVPAQAGQHVSGPAGYPAQGEGGYQAGTLLGRRVGEDGPVFAVGQQYQAPGARGGRLYLRIVPLANGTGPTGAYQVQVSSGPGVEVEGRANIGGRGRRRGASPWEVNPFGTSPAGVPLRPATMPKDKMKAK
jgi:hypothetical protein